jgi:hypothetical protein
MKLFILALSLLISARAFAEKTFEVHALDIRLVQSRPVTQMNFPTLQVQGIHNRAEGDYTGSYYTIGSFGRETDAKLTTIIASIPEVVATKKAFSLYGRLNFRIYENEMRNDNTVADKADVILSDMVKNGGKIEVSVISNDQYFESGYFIEGTMTILDRCIAYAGKIVEIKLTGAAGSVSFYHTDELRKNTLFETEKAQCDQARTAFVAKGATFSRVP